MKTNIKNNLEFALIVMSIPALLVVWAVKSIIKYFKQILKNKTR